jgi:sugar lactone lactonase YvrE
VLVSGAAISGANGLHFGPDGLLYVASVIGSEIVVLDPKTGEVKRRIRQGVKNPDDVAFNRDGDLYWTSILSGEVTGLRPDGSLVTAARLTPGTNPITFSPEGRLFVSQCFFDDKLYEVDPQGVNEPRLISDQLGPGCGLNGMDWGPDGRLYGPRWFRGEVVSFDVDTREMRVEAKGFRVPAAVKFDSHGTLHVLDTAEGAVLRISGGGREKVASLSPGLDNLAFDQQDRLFVSSFVDGFVARVEADGSHTLLTPSGLAHPGGLTLRDVGDGLEVVVADLQAVRGFDAATGESTFVHRNVFGVGELGSVTHIATDGENLLLTSWLGGTVKLWDPALEKIVESHGELATPVSALRYGGRIVVAEHGKGRVIAIGPAGSKQPEVIASGLPAATGLAVRDGDLFVSDRLRGEVLRIARAGSRLQAPEVVASNLSAPEGLAATEDGFLVVEADSGRIIEIGADGTRGKVNPIATTSPGTAAPTAAQPPSMIFNGVAVSPDGVVFATDETRRQLVRIEPR